MPQNERLYQRIRQIVQNTLHELRQAGRTPFMWPQPDPFTYKRLGDEDFDINTDPKWIDAGQNIEHVMLANGLAEFEAELAEHDLTDGRLTKIARSAVGGAGRSVRLILARSFFSEYMDTLIYSGAEKTPPQPIAYRFVEDCFDRIYDKFERELFSDQTRMTVYLPVCGIQAEPDMSWRIDTTTVLRRMNTAEISAAIRAAAVPTEMLISSSFRVALQDQWAIAEDQTYPIRYFDTNEDARAFHEFPRIPDLYAKAEPIIQALRICFGGSVVATRRLAPRTMTMVDLHAGSLDDIPMPITFPDQRNPCKVSRSQIPQLNKVWRGCRSIPPGDNRIRVALSRLVDSGTRVRATDALVDMCIAVEALFGDKTERIELGYKVALRAAIFAHGAIPDVQPPAVFRFIKEIYAVRSAVVHGGSPGINPRLRLEGTRGSIEDLRADLEYFLRQTLQFAVTVRPGNPLRVFDHGKNLEHLLASLPSDVPSV